MSTEIKTLASREIYRNRWMTLKEDKILRADGSEGLYSVVEKQDFVVIVPVQDKAIYVVEQYRYPLGQRTIELPQGSWEHLPSASPAEVAAGELREETGLKAGRLICMGYQKLAQGFSAQGYHIYFATQLSWHGQQLDAEEVGLKARKLTVRDFTQLVLEGKITDATSVTAFLLAKAKGLISE